MPVIISPSSVYGRELWAWDHTEREVHPDDNDLPDHLQLRGKRPAIPLEYPKMLFKARKKTNGQISVGEVYPNAMDFPNMGEFERATIYIESFNRSCQRLVGDEDEERKAKNEGWCVLQTDALEKAKGLEQDIADAAAYALHKNQSMSEKARAEFAAADAATSDHVTDIVSERGKSKPVSKA